MKIKEIANNDNKIIDFLFDNNCINIKIELWDGRIKSLKCNKYYGMKEKQCINSEIGDIKENETSIFMSEIKVDIENGGGDGTELNSIKSFVFYNAWNEQIILEILAESIEIMELESQ
ncbi:MAG: hypothetical protein J6N21_22390 [Butyrivibrio sp.]|nr:hypothetical protein [Butyrivibrio sp.]